MQIDGLTEQQVEMLDHMWSLDTMEEFDEWVATLDADDTTMALSLQKMILFATLDESMEQMRSYPDANQLLKQFRL